MGRVHTLSRHILPVSRSSVESVYMHSPLVLSISRPNGPQQRSILVTRMSGRNGLPVQYAPGETLIEGTLSGQGGRPLGRQTARLAPDAAVD